jgi:hypothetical protein
MGIDVFGDVFQALIPCKMIRGAEVVGRNAVPLPGRRLRVYILRKSPSSGLYIKELDASAGG